MTGRLAGLSSLMTTSRSVFFNPLITKGFQMCEDSVVASVICTGRIVYFSCICVTCIMQGKPYSNHQDLLDSFSNLHKFFLYSHLF